ncbi:MAG: cell division transport system ATP-binding protein [Microbacteriaceae bacterium]|jgi:cell division transport system ATP-binding protein|nr:cell division transport system ATP-binding protein [Microbacteriaceae bacterium]
MIRFDHVSKQYSGTTRPALNAINLEVLRGEFVFLVGASGSGKSSCLRLILKEEKPTKGKIHVLGQDVGAISSRKVPYFRRNIGVVFQDFRLLPNKSVFDNVAFTLQVIGKSRGFIQEAVPDVLKMVGLSGKASRLPHELSGGEQQRVAIARAVVNKPQVLLADEPTGNLDPATSAGIMAVLERINAAGTTVLMATHEAGIVDQMQRRVIELVSGQIVRDERHGGYGFTSAIPTTHGAVADAMGDTVTRNTAPVRLPTHVVTDLHAAELSAEAAAAAPPVLVPTRAAEAQPTPVAPESVVPEQSVPEPAAPAEAEQVPIEPTTETARLSAHFAAPPTQPVIRTQPLPDEELPEQLSLAEKLGLRAPGDDQDITGEQNVGPTK